MFVNFPLFVRVFLCFGCLFGRWLVGWFGLSSVCQGVLEYFFHSWRPAETCFGTPPTCEIV